MKYRNVKGCFLIAIVIFCFGCNNSSTNKSESKLVSIGCVSDDTLKIIQSIEKQCADVDVQVRECKKLLYSQLIDTQCWKLELSVKNNKPLELYCSYCYNDSVTCYEKIIFLKSCLVELLIAKGNNSGVSVYFGNHKTLCYVNDNDTIEANGTSGCNDLPIEDESIFSRRLSSYMHFFPGINYLKITASSHSDPTIATKMKMPLRYKPETNSAVVENLPKQCALVYLTPGPKLDTISKKIWIWYTVRIPNGKVGWVFGHPDFIDEIWNGGDD